MNKNKETLLGAGSKRRGGYNYNLDLAAYDFKTFFIPYSDNLIVGRKANKIYLKSIKV